MMYEVRDWMVSLICITVLLTCVQLLLPEGTMQKIGNLIGGLILLVALLQPLFKIESSRFRLDWSSYQDSIAQRQAQLLEEEGEDLQELIEVRTAAYISDKARELGLSVSVQIRAQRLENGIPIPTEAVLYGSFSKELSAWIERELGIPGERQVWNEGKN